VKAGEAGEVPAARLRTCFAQHPLTEPPDQAALFGDRDKLRRRYRADARTVPAQQRFGADHLARPQRDDRLVHRGQPPLGDRVTQVAIDDGAAFVLPGHSSVKNSTASPP